MDVVTDASVEVEEEDTDSYVRVSEGAVDVEEEDTDSYIRASDGGIDVEEEDTTKYAVVSNAAVMVEYREAIGDCGIHDVDLISYMQFAADLHCYLSRADEAGLSPTAEITIGCWIFFSNRSMGADVGIMGKWYSSDNQCSYVLHKKANGEIVFDVSVLGTNVNYSASDFGRNFGVGKWIYVVGRVESTRVSLFVNGEWFYDTPVPPTTVSIFDSTEPFEIGRYDRSYYLDGGISHAFVSGEAIENVDIEAMYYHAKAMFQYASEEAHVLPSNVATRMTNAGVNIEYTPVDYLRMTNAGINIEYGPTTYIYMTDAAMNIEYTPFDYLRMTNAAIQIEYEPKDYLRTTNAGVMIEYSSSSSSSTSSSSSSSSSTTSSSSSVPP